MQTEKEFKEVARTWINDSEVSDYLNDIEIDDISNLMWLSYNQAIKDMNK